MTRFLFCNMLACALFASASVAAEPQPSSEKSCEMRVWQSRDYVSDSASNYGAFGLIGALAQSHHDSRYPKGSTESRLEFELRQEVIDTIFNAAPWAAAFPASSMQIRFADGEISRDAIKALRSNKQRNSQSIAPCYIEFYIDRQTFLGGMVQSNLMSEFTVKVFKGSSVRTVNGKAFKKVKGFPAKDTETVDAATVSIRAAFADNVGDFVRKKLAAGLKSAARSN